jgi:hypothetical protein
MPHKVATNPAAGSKGWRGLGLGRCHRSCAIDEPAGGTPPAMNGNAAIVRGAAEKAQ